MILDVEIYNDHIRQVKDLSLTVATLEETLKVYKYSGEGKKKEEVVENLKMPPMTLSFYSYLYDTGKIPTDLSLVEEYLNGSAFSYIPDGKVEVDYMGVRTVVSLEGLCGRILRTYPSIVRDLHFYLLLKETEIFEAVRYSVKADFEDGVDIKVKFNGKWYNVGLRLTSRRSWEFWKKKKQRHNPIEIIHITLDDCPSRRVGDYDLFSDHHIHKLLKHIKSK
jgi:hypothetical protein